MEDTVIKIAEKIKKLRKDAGYSSYDYFAFKNNIPRIQYWRMEKGTNFTIKSLIRILEVHGLSIKEFFSDIK